MKKWKIDVGKKIRLSYAALIFILLAVSIMGIWAVNQTHAFTEKMYNHPLQIRRALAVFELQVDKMSLNVWNSVSTDNSEELDHLRKDIVIRKEDAKQRIQILKERYLGPAEDVLEIEKAYMIWEDEMDQTITLINQGEKDAAISSMLQNGSLATLKLKMSEKIEVVDDFAKSMADKLYANSVSAERSTYTVIAILFLFSVLFAFAVVRYIHRSINTPLSEMQSAMKNISKGKLDTRAKIIQDDEFGEISNVLNDMLEKLEAGQDIDEKASEIINQMLSAELIEEFFSKVLLSILKHTKGELGAVYLSSTDQNTFEIVTSIGMSEKGRASFNIKNLEGDLGRAVASRKIERFTLTTEDERFQHPIPYGEIFPKEIITIPIFDNDNAIAIVTIASINGFHPTAVSLIENIYPVLIARVVGVLSNNEIMQMRDELEYKNDELKQQQCELQLQTAEIEQQKTELEKQNENLSEVSRLKTSFLSNMSHELRTPLNSVIALSGILERRLKGQIPEEEHSYLEVIERSGKNLLLIINDILDISKIEAGRINFDIDRFNLRDLIKELAEMLEPLAKEKAIKMIDNSGDLGIHIVSDEQKLRQILQNLIGNAVKFTEKGWVEISASARDGQAVIIVSDTGTGIAKEHLSDIFEEFKQGDGSTTRKYGGTGLGLAISKKYTELLGGTLEVESTLDKGSTFTVTIPLQYLGEYTEKQSDQLPEMTSIKRENSNEKTYRLLIVEDSEPAIIQIKDALDDENYQTTVAHDGAEALKMIAENIPDGIILDLMMPMKDGFQVLTEVRNMEQAAYVPILVLTAKHITKEELKTFKHNHIHQLVQKGSLSRQGLIGAVASMFHPQVKPAKHLQNTLKNQAEKPVLLVVEDNPDNRLTISALLKEKYTIIEAENGEIAVEAAKVYTPDLILMDIALPGMDGVEAFKIIRKNPKLAHIPVIALTASAMTTDREIFLAYGFDAFIPKPIIEKYFMRIIQEVLHG